MCGCADSQSVLASAGVTSTKNEARGGSQKYRKCKQKYPILKHFGLFFKPLFQSLSFGKAWLIA